MKNFFNVFHFSRNNVINAVSEAHIASAFATAIQVPLLAALSVDYTQTALTVRLFEDATRITYILSQSGVGGQAADRLPDFSAVTLQLKSSQRGKTGRGSKHFGPIAEADTTGDDLQAAAVTRFQTLGAAIVAGFTDSDVNIWLPCLKGAPRIGSPAQYTVNPTTSVITSITSYLLNKSLGTMRRRKIKTVN